VLAATLLDVSEKVGTTDPEARFDALVDELLGTTGVTPPSPGKGFGSSAIRVQNKIFAMLVRGRLVVKLPKARVDSLVEEIAKERGDDLKVVKLNIDENQQTAMQFNVMSIPTLILFRHGQPAKTVIGAYPKKRLEAELEPALA